jgi:carboxyl-terminal processing protease
LRRFVQAVAAASFSTLQMPRRNLIILLALGVFALICYQKHEASQYAQTLSESLDVIHRLALEKVASQDLFEGAMQGMVERIDQYSAYIPPKALRDFNEAIEQQFGGVGMEFGIDPETRQMTVISPIVGTPAYEAGVRSGDRILRIGPESTQGMSLNDAVSLMRGKPGEPVSLTVLHPGEDKPVDIQLVRALIKIDTVLGDTRNPDLSWNYFLAGSDRIGYVRVVSFGEKTGEDLKKVLQRLTDHGMKGLILDLRDNPGGLLAAAQEVCDLFIESGVIVTTRGREGNILETTNATGQGPFTGFPMVVLVNQFSASASEIVAACLQDHNRAAIVGERTWGKGTVQKIIDLDETRGALRLTTASYWRPSNKNIHRGRDAGENDDWGVRPDPGCHVSIERDEFARLHLWRMHRDAPKPAADRPETKADKDFVDRQLAKAVECLKERMELKRHGS